MFVVVPCPLVLSINLSILVIYRRGIDWFLGFNQLKLF